MTNTQDDPAAMLVDVAEFGSVDELLATVAAGAALILTAHGRPVARIEPIGPDGPQGIPVARETAAEYGADFDSPGSASALARLVGSGAVRSILGVFVMAPDTRIHQREMARRAGVGLRSAQLALDHLQALGLVASERDGNRRYYRAVRTGRFERLRALMQPEFGVAAAALRALEPFRDQIRWAFIYGSTAKGDDTVASDIDLLVVGDVSRLALGAALSTLESELERQVGLTLYRPEAFIERRDHGNHFITAVLAGPRIDLLGGPGDA